MVPETSSRVDGNLIRVNHGERIDVTPRGMVGGDNTFHFVFKIAEQTIFDVVNRGARAGELHTLVPASNL